MEVIIYDQQSTYPPLLEYYKTQNVIYNTENGGPYSVWKLPNVNKDFYIVADSDCTYEGIPEDWLDKMLAAHKRFYTPKVGFSLKIDDLPENELTKQVIYAEKDYRLKHTSIAYLANLDTTFCLYKPGTDFTYLAVRLKEPYELKHEPWYLTELNEEWKYYLDHASSISTWGMKLKKLFNI